MGTSRGHAPEERLFENASSPLQVYHLALRRLEGKKIFEGIAAPERFCRNKDSQYRQHCIANERHRS